MTNVLHITSNDAMYDTNTQMQVIFKSCLYFCFILDNFSAWNIDFRLFSILTATRYTIDLITIKMTNNAIKMIDRIKKCFILFDFNYYSSLITFICLPTTTALYVFNFLSLYIWIVSGVLFSDTSTMKSNTAFTSWMNCPTTSSR